MLCNTQILINQGKRILDRCDRLTKHCNEEQLNQYYSSSAVNNEMDALGVEIDKYKEQVDRLKSSLKSFGDQIFDDLKAARKNLLCRSKAMVGQGISVAMSVLIAIIGYYIGDTVGKIILTFCVLYGGLGVNTGYAVYIAGSDVMQIKTDCEEKLKMTEEQHQKLCKQYTTVKNSFANCKAVVPVQPNTN